MNLPSSAPKIPVRVNIQFSLSSPDVKVSYVLVPFCIVYTIASEQSLQTISYLHLSRFNHEGGVDHLPLAQQPRPSNPPTSQPPSTLANTPFRPANPSKTSPPNKEQVLPLPRPTQPHQPSPLASQSSQYHRSVHHSAQSQGGAGPRCSDIEDAAHETKVPRAQCSDAWAWTVLREVRYASCEANLEISATPPPGKFNELQDAPISSAPNRRPRPS